MPLPPQLRFRKAPGAAGKRRWGVGETVPRVETINPYTLNSGGERIQVSLERP